MKKVYWITGLSGAGKTTIGTALYEKLAKENKNVIILDGDELRQSIGDGVGYSTKERNLLANRYARLCKLLYEQEMIVICCTIAMFHKVRAWNKENIGDYVEVYLKPDMSVLETRNKKGLYSKDNSSQTVGVTLEVEEPLCPDVIIKNNGDLTADEIVATILKL